MERSCRVTIGMPFLNARPTLADAVRSVFAQTCQEWELILVDDGSTDGSSEIVCGINDPRVILIQHGACKGGPARRNEIIDMARGEYMAWLDADDMMHPSRLARQLDVFTQQPATDAVGSAAYTIDEFNRVLGIRGERPLSVKSRDILRRGAFLHPTVTGKMEWFRKHRYDPTLLRSHDRELWVRACRTSQYVRISEPLVFYREKRTVNLRNYLDGNREMRQVVRREGPALVGAFRSWLLIGELALKDVLYRSATALGLQHHLVRQRNRSPQASHLAAAERALAQIAATQVPGLDTSALLSACPCPEVTRT